jgi:hypothetical protein
MNMHRHPLQDLVAADAKRLCNEMLSRVQEAFRNPDWILYSVQESDLKMLLRMPAFTWRLWSYGLEVTGKLKELWIHGNTRMCVWDCWQIRSGANKWDLSV